MKKVIVVGAGILGAATAYELAKQKLDVTIIDAHTPGGATAAAAGIICPWVSKRRNKAWYQLAVNGAAYYDTLISELKNFGETNTGYKKVGAIKLHHDLTKLEELKSIALKRRVTAPEIGQLTILDPLKTKSIFPFLAKEYYSLHIEGAARVDGHQLRKALLRVAKQLGAKNIHGNAELIQREKEIIGVTVNGTNILADLVIATNGVWMNQLLSPLQIDLHFQAQKGEILHLKTDKYDTANLPVVNPPNNQYILCFDNGRVVAGATHEITNEISPVVTASGIHYLLEEGLKVAPGLSDASILEAKVGYRPFTHNHLPIFGRIPTVNGIMIANGLGASGLTTGPYIGHTLAKMANQQQINFDITPYEVKLGHA